jgi:hypothetical protein
MVAPGFALLLAVPICSLDVIILLYRQSQASFLTPALQHLAPFCRRHASPETMHP